MFWHGSAGVSVPSARPRASARPVSCLEQAIAGLMKDLRWFLDTHPGFGSSRVASAPAT
jgi:hypothetical protein